MKMSEYCWSRSYGFTKTGVDPWAAGSGLRCEDECRPKHVDFDHFGLHKRALLYRYLVNNYLIKDFLLVSV